MVRRSGGACNQRQSGYECGEGVVGQGFGGEKEVMVGFSSDNFSFI